MKTRFSIGKALEAPFVLLRTQPLALFGWGALRVLLSVAALAVMMPFFATMTSGETHSPEDMDRLMQTMLPMQGGIQALNLVNLVLGVVIWTAAMRATTASRGTKDRFLFLRVGMDELYVGVIMLIAAIGLYIGAFIVALLGAVICYTLWHVSEVAGVAFGVIYGLAAIAGALWLTGRIMLLMPASLALHTFAFEQGWVLGKGQGWKLAATGLLAWLILMVAYIVVITLVIGIFIGAAVLLHASIPRFDTIHSFPELVAMARPFLIPAIIIALPIALFDGFCHAMFAGPLASACQQLMQSGKTPVPANGGDADAAPAL